MCPGRTPVQNGDPPNLSGEGAPTGGPPPCPPALPRDSEGRERCKTEKRGEDSDRKESESKGTVTRDSGSPGPTWPKGACATQNRTGGSQRCLPPNSGIVGRL